jgi:hypothetical protein
MEACVFPQYALPAAPEPTVQEIRLASWAHKPFSYSPEKDSTSKSNHMYSPHLEAYPLGRAKGSRRSYGPARRHPRCKVPRQR